jgi:hypothetical protein
LILEAIWFFLRRPLKALISFLIWIVGKRGIEGLKEKIEERVKSIPSGESSAVS